MKKFILDLIEVRRNEAVTTSLNVAKIFGKKHKNVLRDIDTILENASNSNDGQGTVQLSLDCMENSLAQKRALDSEELPLEELKKMFSESTYKGKDGKYHRMYYMNIDGFSLLTLGFSGKKALKWRIKYVLAFKHIISLLAEKNTIEWQEVRAIGKQVRNELTDTIKDYLIPLAIEQGSQNYNRYYKIYSTLADETAGVMNRDFATSIQLNNLRMAENIIKNVIILRSEEKMYYKDIYQTCKERLQQFKEISFLT